MIRTPLIVIGAALVAAAGCAWARPVTYGLPPGISASFAPSELMVSTDFAKMFCSVLEGEFAAAWDSCEKYVAMPAPHPPATLGTIPTDYTLLELGGFGAECLINIDQTFGDALRHLATHGVQSHHVPMGAFDSSHDNAEDIRDFVAARPAAEKFIALAHSKGAADLMEAFVRFPTEMSRIHAVITVSGAVGGSWLVDRLPGRMGELLQAIGATGCSAQVSTASANAVHSMRRETRQKFLAANAHMNTQAFSISAVSTEANTSTILKPLWKRLEPYGWEQDSHIMEREAIVPGGVFLGRALGDHMAVAFPLDANVPNRVRELMDKNPFPRPALIEAAVRIARAQLPP